MALRQFQALWYPADGSPAMDVTRKLMKLGPLSRGVSDPNKVLAYIAGDLSLEFLNADGWANDQFSAARAPNIKKFPQVDIFRLDPTSAAFVRFFRGFVEGNNAEIGQRKKKFNVTALGPRRLLDQLDAESKIRRTFQPMLVTTFAPEGQSFLSITPPSPGNNLLIADVIRVAIPGTDPANPTEIEHTIQGITQGNVYLTEPLENSVAAGSVVTCATPFYRNVDLLWLVGQIFQAAGIPTYDARFTGSVLKSVLPFLSTLNTSGLTGLGSVRGIQYVKRTGSALGKVLDVTFSPGDASKQCHQVATTASSGFVQEIDNFRKAVDQYSGGLYDKVDAGQEDPDNPTEGLLTQPRMDYVSIPFNTPPFSQTTYLCTKSVTCVNRGQHYALIYKETIKSLDYPEASPELNLATGGGAYTLALFKLNGQLGSASGPWTIDTAAFRPIQIQSATFPDGGGTANYGYIIETFYNFDGHNGGRIGSAQLDAIGGPNTLSGTSRVRLSFARRLHGNYVATQYRVYRVQTSGAFGNGASTGLIATIADPGGFPLYITFDDVGALATFGTPYTDGLLISSGNNATSSNGETGLNFDTSLECVEAVRDRLLLACCWMGGGENSTNNQLLKLRLTSAGDDVETVTTVAYSCKGARAIAVNPPSPTKMDVWRVDSNLGVLIHGTISNTDLDTSLITTVNSIPYGNKKLFLKTIKWNRDTSVAGARVSVFFCDDTDGRSNLYCGFLSLNRTTPYPQPLDSVLKESVLVAPLSQFNSSGPDRAQPEIWDNNLVYANWWKISIGGTAFVWVLVGHIPQSGAWFIIAKNWTGFIEYADMTDLDGTGALEEYGIPVNARVEVDWTPAGVPYGRFLSRDLIPLIGAVTKDFTKNGRNNDQVIDVKSLGMYANSFSEVEVTGASGIKETDTIFKNPDGSPDFKDRRQKLQIKSRAISTSSFAKVVAKALADFFGPRDATTGDPLPPKGAHELRALDDWRTAYIPQSEIILIDEEGNPQTGWIQNIEEDGMRGKLVIKAVEQ